MCYNQSEIRVPCKTLFWAGRSWKIFILEQCWTWHWPYWVLWIFFSTSVFCHLMVNFNRLSNENGIIISWVSLYGPLNCHCWCIWVQVDTRSEGQVFHYRLYDILSRPINPSLRGVSFEVQTAQNQCPRMLYQHKNLFAGAFSSPGHQIPIELAEKYRP